MSGSGPAAGPLQQQLPPDIRMLERGWLSSNSVLLTGDPRGAVLVDSGYCTHKAQTLALVQESLRGDPHESAGLRLIVNTHLHSDHCGGNAHLSAHYGCPIWVPPGHFQAACDWDEAALSYRQTGQRCERFSPAAPLLPGSGALRQAGRTWQALAAPGHDPHSLILFEPQCGLLISADALWEHGFGIVFPQIGGGSRQGFDEVAATLDLIAALPARVVIPGHGPAFADAAQALQEARERLEFFRRNPQRHARYAAKALIKYHLLEVVREPLAELLAWLDATPIHAQLWEGFFQSQAIDAWTMEVLAELERSHALNIADGWVANI